jgi:hypothetical protein
MRKSGLETTQGLIFFRNSPETYGYPHPFIHGLRHVTLPAET